jgi:hypothetical protein
LIFGGTSMTLSTSARWSGIVAVALLVASTIAYVSASHYRIGGDANSDEEYYAGLRGLVRSIDCRARWGSGLGLVALLAVFCTVLAGSIGPKDDATVRVTLSKSALDQVHAVCPGATTVLPGEVDMQTLDGSGTLVELDVAAPVCDPVRTVRLHLPRTSLAAVAQD